MTDEASQVLSDSLTPSPDPVLLQADPEEAGEVDIFGGLNDANEQEGGQDEELPNAGQEEGEDAEGEGKEEVTDSEVPAEGEEDGDVEPEPSLSASYKDKEVQVPEEAVFEVKVNGKVEKVSAKDLIRNYQGKIPWDAYHQQQAEQKRQLEQERASVQASKAQQEDFIKDVIETFKTNPYKAFDKLAVSQGIDPTDLLPVYIAQSKKTVEELRNLSEAEYKALLIQRKANFESEKNKRELERLEKDRTELKSKEEGIEAERYYESLAVKHQISEDELKQAVETLKEAKIDFSGLSRKQVTDYVVNYILSVDRPLTRVENIVKEVSSDLYKDNKFILELKNLITPDMSDEDIQEIVRAYVGDAVESKPQAKAPSLPSKKKELAPKAKAPSNERRKEPLNEDDIGPISMRDILAGY